MTLTHLIERCESGVAKAIYEARNGHGCKPWSRLPKSHQEPYLSDARAAITAYQAEAWQPRMVKLTPEDERLLDKALLSSTDVLYPILPVDAGFETVRDAYVRGAKWSLGMGMHYKIEELHKAAYDYADKALPPAPKASP